ncbi:MAG: transglutaminase domain-containing protein [Isosphaeraceae bacterium]
MVTESEDDWLVRATTWVLTALATGAAELALAEPGRPAAVSLAVAAGLCALALGAHAWIGRPARAQTATRGWVVAALLVLFLLPFLAEGIRLLRVGHAQMLELVLLAVLRNLGLGLAVLARSLSFRRLAALVSLFLILVASPVAEGPVVLGILGAYAFAGSLWLMLAYWRGLPRSITAGHPRRLPVLTPLVILAIVGGAVAFAAIGPTRAAAVLAGLLPSSGGTYREDPDARGGVNDGENEVKGSDKPESVGYTESDTYLDTDRPSLYDAFNDMYGEPFKPKQRDRMVALSNSNVIEQKERPAENLRAGRQFAAVRRPPKDQARRPSEREARAMLYVKGRTPLHLGLVAYDRFDGTRWEEEPHCSRDCPLVLEDESRAWFRIDLPAPSIFAATLTHQIKIGTLDSSPMPVPSHLSRFRVGQVNRPDFFGWSHDGMVRMVGRTVPAGTVIETEARSIDPRRLSRVDFPWESAGGGRLRMFAEDYRVDSDVEALARSWAGGTPRGWDQVEAVVAALRRHAAHDRQGTAPPDCTDVVAHFLLRSRRGPDYQFATAAAVLLRSLGYRTRLVSGLYAAPGQYDPRTRHTAVRREDVHVWAEVRLPSGTWVGIEPTPGYVIAGPALSFWESALAVLTEAGRWARSHALGLGFAALLAFALIWYRRELLDRLATLIWWACREADPRGCAVRTLRLVERRSHWAGCPRPPGLTPRRWYGPIALADPDLAPDLDSLLRLAEWSLYAPSGPGRPLAGNTDDPAETCMRVVRGWTIRRFRTAGNPTTRKERWS